MKIFRPGDGDHDPRGAEHAGRNGHRNGVEKKNGQSPDPPTDNDPSFESWIDGLCERYGLVRKGHLPKPTITPYPLYPGLTEDDTFKLQQFVTLDQMAAVICRSKRTLEKHKGKMPAPKVRGGGGRASEWDWDEVRPWLEKYAGKNLPKIFPGHLA